MHGYSDHFLYIYRSRENLAIGFKFLIHKLSHVNS